jgi:hypothetical protein
LAVFPPAIFLLADFLVVCFLAFFLEVATISELLFVSKKSSAPLYYKTRC